MSWYDKTQIAIRNKTRKSSDSESRKKFRLFIQRLKNELHGHNLMGSEDFIQKVNEIKAEVFNKSCILNNIGIDDYPYFKFELIVLNEDENLDIIFEFSPGTRTTDGSKIHYFNDYNMSVFNKQHKKTADNLILFLTKEIESIWIDIAMLSKISVTTSFSYSKNIEMHPFSDTHSSHSDLFRKSISNISNDLRNYREYEYYQAVEELYNTYRNFRKIKNALEQYDGIIDSMKKFNEFFKELDINSYEDSETYTWDVYTV